MLRRYTTQDYDKMASTLATKYAADRTQDLEGIVVKHACGEGMMPDQIRNLVHALNNMTFLELFKKDKEEGKDPLGEFPPVDPESAIAKVEASPTEPGGGECDGSCKKCVLSDNGCGGDSEYDALSDVHGDFPDLLGGDLPADGATVKITIEKQASAENGTSDPRVMRDNRIRGERIVSAVRERKYAAAFAVQEEVEKLAYALQRVGAPDLGRVNMLVDAVDRPFMKLAFDMVLGSMGRDPIELTSRRVPRAYNPKETPLPELTKIADALHQIRVITMAEKKVERYVASLPR